MHKPTSRLLLLLICLSPSVLGLALGAASDADEVREEFHHSYPLTASGRVSLHNVAGGVRITAWDKNEVKVDAVKRAGSRERLAEAEIKVETTADSIRIWTKYPDTRWNGNERYDNFASVDYTVSVPRGARLDSVELVSGSLDISGVAGDVRASTVSGHFKVTGLAGEAKLSTVSAQLEATFDRLTESKPVTLNSVSGAIVLTLPSDAQAQLRANTLSGPITNDFGLEARTGSYVGHELYGQLGSGATQIKLNTVSGRIAIQHAADGKTLSPATSLLTRRDSESAIARVRVRSLPSEAWLKAQRHVAQARAELRTADRETNTMSQGRAARALAEAERNLAQTRAELQRAQNNTNRQAVVDAERKLAEVRRESAAAQRERARALGEAQRKMVLAEGDLQRIQREQNEKQLARERARRELSTEAQRSQRETQLRIQRDQSEKRLARERELQESRNESLRIQREMRETIRRETLAQIQAQQAEIQRDVTSATNARVREITSAAVRDSMGPIGRLRFSDSESKTFNVGAKPRVTIGTFDGRITIHAWDKDEVMYTAAKRTFEENALKGITLRSDQKDSEVSITANIEESYVHRLAGVRSGNAYTSIDVYVPRNATIHASTGEGSITVEGVAGEIELRNSSGSILASNCKGHLTVNAGSGRVQVSNFEGELDARAGLGGMHLSGRFTQLTAQTNNQPIYLTVSPDTDAIIEANSGSVVNEGLQATEEAGSPQRVRRFKAGRGGPLFTLRAGEGRIVLRRADNGPM